jgi:hypothetical protein
VNFLLSLLFSVAFCVHYSNMQVWIPNKITAHSAELRLRAMQHSSESKFVTLESRLAPRIRNRIRKYFRVLIRGLGVVDFFFF